MANKKKSSIGCIFWVGLIALVLIIFLFNRSTINSVIESTGFLNFISQKNEKETKVVRIGENSEEEDTDEHEETEKEPEIIIDVLEVDGETQGKEEETVTAKEDSEKREDTLTRVETEEKKVRKSKLYFIDVGPEGEINLKAVERSVYFIDSPLTVTIETLIEGLLPSELNKELMTLIPEGSKLLSAKIVDATAFLNFNEAFRFNILGAEGSLAQLKQIVYTATEFSTVQRVQLLIEGERGEVLNQEGVYIGVPITRNSFR